MTASITKKNLEYALSGEAHAFMKYSFFAKQCRKLGDIKTAELFEAVAAQEINHGVGHLEVLMEQEVLTPARMLEMAAAGELEEANHMYPTMAKEAQSELEKAWAVEHAQESAEHAELFASQIEKAKKRFSALIKAEAHHAGKYLARKAEVSDEA